MIEWYVVMRKQGWDALTFSANGFPCRIEPNDDPDQPIGFIPVFETREAAEKWADGDPIRRIRPIPGRIGGSRE